MKNNKNSIPIPWLSKFWCLQWESIFVNRQKPLDEKVCPHLWLLLKHICIGVIFYVLLPVIWIFIMIINEYHQLKLNMSSVVFVLLVNLRKPLCWLTNKIFHRSRRTTGSGSPCAASTSRPAERSGLCLHSPPVACVQNVCIWCSLWHPHLRPCSMSFVATGQPGMRQLNLI